MGKNLPANAGTTEVWAQFLDRYYPLEEEISNTPQYSYLENSINRGVLWATDHGVTESDTTND